MNAPQILGIILLIGTMFFWRLIPGWEPFNYVDMSAIPFAILAVWLLVRGAQR